MSDHYFNTTRVRGRQLASYRAAAESQDEKVLEFFNQNPDRQFTPEDIGRLVLPGTPRTSWGRTLTDLTTIGLLEKTDEQTTGVWGRPIYYWRLARRNPNQQELQL